ncbi:hypothetical protein GCWU000325_01002 [Alloprevotella tannerae ATCC 51259]|uniref:Uncharacterized protein n=1 Tax=Alloprevotella tannerae ATCC 51259 TaxID=626522 RepID=C9LFL9_9BACT|nr:hypothetical protein GCWU000325_01002 [Alloprevotella tannerae ATCC 51259]
MAGLALRPNACPAKRPSLRACIDRMSFVGWDRIAFRSRIYMWLMFSRLKLPCYRASASTNNSIAVARTYKRD